MAVTGTMNAKHARSPVIKIVAGENEIFDEQDPELAVNVFYVSRSLLLENSTYFSIILDSTPERAVVFLPEHDYVVLEDWLDLIYQGRLKPAYQLSHSFQNIHKYMVFADLVGSEKLRNVVVDDLQKNVASKTVYNLRDLQDNYPSLTVCFDIILEYQAYIIVTQGWTEFMEHTHNSNSEGGLLAFLADKNNASIVRKLFAKVDQLNHDFRQHKLVDPKERKGCKWHGHATDESKAECMRNAQRDRDMNGDMDGSFETLEGKKLKINGHQLIKTSSDDDLAPKAHTTDF